MKAAWLAAVATYSASDIALMCSGDGFAGSTYKYVYASSDGGRGFGPGVKAPNGGDGGTLAEPEPGHFLLATFSALGYIADSVNGGRTWHGVATFGDNEGPLSDFGFTTPDQGFVIAGHASPGPSQMFLSTDAGQTWPQVRF